MNPTIDMLVSPYDRGVAPSAPPQLVQLRVTPKQRWVPSRYNARTVGDDGRLILWNTLSGAVSVFLPKDREAIVQRLSPKGLDAPLDKTAEYLHKRGYLVRDSVSEMDLFRLEYARQQWRTDVLELILLASEDCNFRCKYCYEKFKHGTMEPQVREGIKAMLLKRAPKLRSVSVEWFGGEPLYGWEAIEDLSPFFKEVAERNDVAHWQAMTTNAYLLTEERATKLLEWGCRGYQITIDGLPEEHDCKRVGRDGSPTYSVILDNLRSLKARNDAFKVAIRVNFDQENLPRLGTFLEALSEDFGGDARFTLRFRAVGRWGGANDEQLNTCGVTEQRDATRQLRQMADAANLHQEGGIMEFARPGSQVCYAARPYNFIIGATGKLMKCTIVLDEMDANVVGQIHPDGRMEVKNEQMANWVRPFFETDSLCQSCYVLPGCQGGTCPLSRVRYGERTCCGVKKELKTEMRFTLAEAARSREQLAAAT